MTLDELADLPADKLIALTTSQLEEILRPYYTMTRPELIVRTEKKQTVQQYVSPKKQAALALLTDEGIDLSFLQRKKKK